MQKKSGGLEKSEVWNLRSLIVPLSGNGCQLGVYFAYIVLVLLDFFISGVSLSAKFIRKKYFSELGSIGTPLAH